MLHQQGVTGIECARNIVRFGGHFVDLVSREACRFQGIHRAAGTTTRGIQLIRGDRHHAGILRIPAAFFHLFIQFLPLTLANFGGGHHYQRHGVHRFAFGGHKLVIDGNDFQVVTACLGDNGRSELRIGRTDHEAFGTARCQAVDGIQGFLTIRHGNFNHFKAHLFPGFVSKFPLGLEPRFFRLFDQETEFHGLGHS